jgi:AcrR family transcriptional regulator
VSSREPSVKESRRSEILNAASELLAQNPTASLAEISAHAGISNATLHRHFEGRDALMLALAVQIFDQIIDVIHRAEPDQGTATQAFTRIIEALVPLGDKVFFLIREKSLDLPPELDAADQATRAPIRRIIERGQASGEFRAELNADWIMQHLDYALYAMWQAVHDGWVARKEAPRLLVSTLLGGIVAR